MSCFSSQEFTRITRSTSLAISLKEANESEKIIKLLRGGYIIKTIIGNIQFGLPPETIKDALNMKQDVPLYYIIPNDRFNRKYGLSVAEFEFPAYFNYFVRNRKIILICSEEAQQAIKIIFQETLLGPLSHENLKDDFHYTYDSSAYPDFLKELSFFSRNPLDPSERLKIEHLLEFQIFDPITNVVSLEGGKIIIKKDEKSYQIFENSIEIASFKDEVDIDLPESLMIKLPNQSPNTLFEKKIENSKLNLSYRSSFMEFLIDEEDFVKTSFEPPEFGVTVLGCSHGFDPKGSTSGFVFWINGKGVMVDPPPFSTYLLKKIGISSVLIEAIILSHCHADHDSGVFQKIFDCSRVEMITTKTIMNSFLRKYSALSRVPIKQLTELYKFRPAIIGAPLPLFGANFNFFYAFHPIPSLGFEVVYKGKSIFFSADHFYEPKTLAELKEKGILSEKRYEQLVGPKFEQDLILHEAGVPPIHTPQSVLADFSAEIKERLFLVHVAEKDVLKDKGLKAARSGVENTFRLIERTNTKMEIVQKLEIISSMDIFENVGLWNLREFLNVLKEEIFEPNEYVLIFLSFLLIFEKVIKEGEQGARFYIVAKGVAKIYSDSSNKKFSRYVSVGDYFGEAAIIDDDMTRKASVVAMSNLSLLSIERHEFQFIFGHNLSNNSNPLVQNLLQLRESRKTDAITLIFKNRFFSEMKPNQKTQLEMTVKTEKHYQKNEVVWDPSMKSNFVILVKKGAFLLEINEADEPIYCDSGFYVGEVSNMMKGENFSGKLTCIKEGSAFPISFEDFNSFLEKNPGLLFYFSSINYCS